ncbi:MAG: PqiC family protein [Gammaproteobacteria bacterium]
MSGQGDVMKILRRTVAVSTMLLVTACGSSPPTSYYTLDPVYSGSTADGLDAVRIGVGPFVFPELLDRPQIVIRGDRNQVVLSEYARWADDLEKRFQAIVARDLVVATGTDHVYEHPWRDNFAVDYRILGVVDRFAAHTSGTVSLKIRWVVQDGDGEKTLATHEGHYSESADPGDYGDIAAAMGRATASASSDIAQTLAEVAGRDSNPD